jgi:cell division septum initiation protein DivIVA
MEQDSDRDGFDSHRMRDVLDRETIDQIEELHGAVVRAEAEQRFGLLRGKRTRQVAEAEAAEQAFLNQHGFATYNDFRLRIRRSTALHEQAPPTAFDDELAFDDSSAFDPGTGSDHGLAFHDAIDAPPASESAEQPTDTTGSESEPGLVRDTASEHDDGADAAPDDERSEEGSEQMGPLPESAPAPAAPPPVPSFAPKADGDHTASASNDFRRLTEPLFATLQAETDRFVAGRIEAAEKQAADILNRASKEAAEIIGRAAKMHDAMKSLVQDIGRQSEAFLSVTEELPTQIAKARDGVAADLQALRDLAENGPAKSAPTGEATRTMPAVDAPSVWAAPQRVAPPPPMSSIAPSGD